MSFPHEVSRDFNKPNFNLQLLQTVSVQTWAALKGWDPTPTASTENHWERCKKMCKGHVSFRNKMAKEDTQFF